MATQANNTAVVIGGGVGGLATALRLRHAGWDVTLLEKNATLGGRCNILEDRGFSWDLGPSLFFMTHVFRQLFTDIGRSLDEYMTLRRMDPNYVMHFADGETLTLGSHLPSTIAELERIEPGCSARFMRYLGDASIKYRLGMENFVQQDFHKLSEFTTPANLAALVKTGAAKNYYKHICKVFKDERLRAAFSFQTIYLGDSPLKSPAVYHLLPYTELVEDGLWYAEGGTYSFIRALARIAAEMGVDVRLNTPVGRILTENRKAMGVELATGERVAADIVVSNADLPTTQRTLLDDADRDYTNKALDRKKYTAGAFTMYLGLDVPSETLGHHTIYFPHSFLRCLDDIYTKGVVREDPAFYVSKTCASDPSLAPPGCSNLFVLVPTPHLGTGVDWAEERPRMRDRMLDLLERRAGIKDIRKHIVAEHILDPEDWKSRFGLDKGAAFGLSHGLFQVGYFRPDIAGKKVKGLYFVGASSRPGTGVPLVLIGAKLVAGRIAEDMRRVGPETPHPLAPSLRPSPPTPLSHAVGEGEPEAGGKSEQHGTPVPLLPKEAPGVVAASLPSMANEHWQICNGKYPAPRQPPLAPPSEGGELEVPSQSARLENPVPPLPLGERVLGGERSPATRCKMGGAL